MKKNVYLILISVLLIFSIGCEKSETENLTKPKISFKTTTGYTSADASVAAGAQLKIGVIADANGGENLTNLIVKSNETTKLLDFALNATTLDKDLLITKDATDKETIKVIIRNSKGISDSISFVITKAGNAFGPINTYTSIKMGGQTSATGSFVSLSNGTVYVQTSAVNNQALIDLLYYYNAADLNCIAAPGSNITGIYTGASSPETWTTKQTTYFSRTALTTVTASDFDNAQNDQILLANKVTAADGGRKAKALAVGQVWSFLSAAGKLGMFKVIAVTGTETGTIEIAVKVQK